MAEAHGASARPELPLWPTSTSCRTQDQVLFPNANSIHNSTTPTTRERKHRSARSIPPRAARKSKPNLVIANWLRLMDPAPGQSCPSGQRRHLAALSEDHVLSPDENSFHTPATPTTRGRKQWSPRSIPPRAAKKPQLHIRMLIGWSSWSQRAARVATRANANVPPGRISSHPRIRNPSTSVQLQLTGEENEDSPGRYRSAGVGKPNLTGWLLIG